MYMHTYLTPNSVTSVSFNYARTKSDFIHRYIHVHIHLLHMYELVDIRTYIQIYVHTCIPNS